MNCWEQNNKKKNEKDLMFKYHPDQIETGKCVQVTIHYINTNEIPGKTIILSSNIKTSPLLWLDDNLHLCPSSLYIRTLFLF